MDLALTPRVNGQMLFSGKYIGRSVMVVIESGGAVANPRGAAVVRTSDGLDITVYLPANVRLEDRYYQLIGKVASPNIVEVQNYFSFGNEFDMAIYDQALGITTQYPQFFA